VRHASGNSQKVDNPNQPRPMMNMKTSKLRAAIVAGLSAPDGANPGQLPKIRGFSDSA
jgi:hypothetical protein